MLYELYLASRCSEHVLQKRSRFDIVTTDQRYAKVQDVSSYDAEQNGLKPVVLHKEDGSSTNPGLIVVCLPALRATAHIAKKIGKRAMIFCCLS